METNVAGIRELTLDETVATEGGFVPLAALIIGCFAGVILPAAMSLGVLSLGPDGKIERHGGSPT